MVARERGLEDGGDPHYKESNKESHTVCPFFPLFFGVQADSVSFPGWAGVGLGRGAGRGIGGGGVGPRRDTEKEVILAKPLHRPVHDCVCCRSPACRYRS